jgi:hypothetical protein
MYEKNKPNLTLHYVVLQAVCSGYAATVERSWIMHWHFLHTQLVRVYQYNETNVMHFFVQFIKN